MLPTCRRIPLASIAMFLLVIGLAGCASSELQTETRPNSILATARSYHLLPPDDFTEQQLLKDTALRLRIDAMIRGHLDARGLREAGDDARPDLLVRYVVNVQTEVLSPPPIGQPLSGAMGNLPMQTPILVTVDNLSRDDNSRDLREGVMAVDLLAPATRNLLWRATITQVLSGSRDRILAQTERALDRAFKDLPVPAR